MTALIEERLCERMLPAGILRKGIIIERDSQCVDYEDWLIELINNSQAFMKKTQSEPFTRPESEAHGESDALTSGYSLDFKLAASRSIMHALREMSSQKIVDRGAVFTGPSRRTGEMKGHYIHKVLRGFAQTDLIRIWSADTEEALLNDDEKRVFGFYKTLKKEKNLLFLCPFLLFMNDASAFPVTEACSMVFADFADSFALRREFYADYESYIAYLADRKLVIMRADSFGWRLFDCVPLSASPTLTRLLRCYERYEFAQLDCLLGRD